MDGQHFPKFSSYQVYPTFLNHHLPAQLPCLELSKMNKCENLTRIWIINLKYSTIICSYSYSRIVKTKQCEDNYYKKLDFSQFQHMYQTGTNKHSLGKAKSLASLQQSSRTSQQNPIHKMKAIRTHHSSNIIHVHVCGCILMLWLKRQLNK